jgi:hypothetical protein
MRMGAETRLLAFVELLSSRNDELERRSKPKMDLH